MANFSFYDFQNFSIDPISQLAGLDTAIYQTFESISASHESFFVTHQSPDFPGKSAAETEIFPPSNQNQPCQDSVPCPPNVETKKRKAIATVLASENSCSGISSISGQVSQNENISTTKRSRKGKRLKNADKEEETLREVVHVRARRGQATDSHSLAERVRREKINERLRCLQDIVPGCYKTMGMATMLDEIINYVQSLQNQVEFLSMKLTAASTFYDFNSETDAIEAVQRAKARETTETGRQVKDGNAVFSSSWTL